MLKLFSLICKKCKKEFERKLSSEPTKNTFCSRSCVGSYNRAKSRGKRKRIINRSKLEIWLEEKINKLYPGIAVFNDRKAIRSELDIYFPGLKIAIEINGPTHYRAIYGSASLKKTQRNDKSKATKCINHGIKLYSIDVSNDGAFCDKICLGHLKTICKIIDEAT